MGGNVSRINLWAGLLMAGFGTLVVFVLIPYGVAEPKRINFAALSPSYYPRFVAYALIILGTAVAIRSFLSPDQNTKPSDDIRPDVSRKWHVPGGELSSMPAACSRSRSWIATPDRSSWTIRRPGR